VQRPLDKRKGAKKINRKFRKQREDREEKGLTRDLKKRHEGANPVEKAEGRGRRRGMGSRSGPKGKVYLLANGKKALYNEGGQKTRETGRLTRGDRGSWRREFESADENGAKLLHIFDSLK